MYEPFFFDSWRGMFRILVVGFSAYAILVLMLRLSGKRTLSKMNAFDLVVTVALGSTLATVLLNADVPLFEGILALALLVGLQFLLTWMSVRSDRFKNLIKSEPTLLVHEGQFLEAALVRQRVTRDEVAVALRKNGSSRMCDVQSVVLETDGSMTVVRTLKDK